MANLSKILVASALLLLMACKQEKADESKTAATTKVEAPKVKYDRVPRPAFNRIAQELALPIFWVQDAGNDNLLTPAELTTFWGLSPTKKTDWVTGEDFNATFHSAYEGIAEVHKNGHTKNVDADEAARQDTVRRELAQGRATVVQTVLKNATDEDRAIVNNVLKAAELVEAIYARQRGTVGMEAPATDPSSRTLFYRNQGPWCEAPETEADPNCNGLKARPKAVSGLYPRALQESDPKFCDTLAKGKDGETLMSPFVVVQETAPGKYQPLPYSEAFKEEMTQVSASLMAASRAITSPNETAFKEYLNAAAQAFLDNNWQPADEAWSKMNAQNSKWYLRIGPDEVYFEPCSRKAGFHVSFARINQASLEWQNKLDPVKNDMEKAYAEAGGKPYQARQVSFHLPDFIDIIVNAGDSRDSRGVTIGQSLPNWGPVANEGRGRTVAMTNFYTDPDSVSALRSQAESLFCASAMAAWTDDYAPQLMDTVLHEAAHNLGPSHEYRVGGKTDDQIFGGPMASMLEEFKAQTGALFFTDWLVERNLLDAPMRDKAHTRSIAWAFGQISNGMYDERKKPKPYPQLAAVQLGFLIKEGAATWMPEENAANKTDKGCLALHLDKFGPAVKKLATVAVGVKARGDKKMAEALRDEFIDREGPAKTLLEVVRERWLRTPKSSFLYSVEI